MEPCSPHSAAERNSKHRTCFPLQVENDLSEVSQEPAWTPRSLDPAVPYTPTGVDNQTGDSDEFSLHSDDSPPVVPFSTDPALGACSLSSEAWSFSSDRRAQIA